MVFLKNRNRFFALADLAENQNRSIFEINYYKGFFKLQKRVKRFGQILKKVLVGKKVWRWREGLYLCEQGIKRFTVRREGVGGGKSIWAEFVCLLRPFTKFFLKGGGGTGNLWHFYWSRFYFINKIKKGKRGILLKKIKSTVSQDGSHPWSPNWFDSCEERT